MKRSALLIVNDADYRIDPSANHVAITTIDGLSCEQKTQLKDLLREVKSRHTPGKECTEEDFDTFYQKIFAGWTTKTPHSRPGPKSAKAEFNDRTVAIGRLNVDLPTASVRRKGHQGSPKRPKTDVMQALHPQTNPDRITGSTVFLRATQDIAGNQVVFQYVDAGSRFFPSLDAIDFFEAHADTTTAQAAAMRSHDSYTQRKRHATNIAIAIYFARNRLVWWANGHPVDSRPKEDTTLFNSIKFCADMRLPADTLVALKEFPVFGLFD